MPMALRRSETVLRRPGFSTLSGARWLTTASTLVFASTMKTRSDNSVYHSIIYTFRSIYLTHQ